MPQSTATGYLAHWGLTASPFRLARPETLFMAPAQDEAMARLHFLVENGRQLGLLLGGSGTGKSLLLQAFGRRLQRAGQTTAIGSLAGGDRSDLLLLVAAALGVHLSPRLRPGPLWRAVCDALAEAHLEQRRGVLLLDDGDQAETAALSELVRLLHHDAADVLTVILTGSDGLRHAPLRLLHLADLRIDLATWGIDDTLAYLATAIECAGGQSAIFEQSATARLHDLAEGLPRQIAQLADLCLVAGASQRLSRIDAETVLAVCEELVAIEL